MSNEKERVIALPLLRTGRAPFNASDSSVLKLFLYQAAGFFSNGVTFPETLFILTFTEVVRVKKRIHL